MLGQRSSCLDPGRTGYGGRRRPERVGEGSSRHRRYRAGVECLEDRRLLSAITEFPLPTADSGADWITAGPDGNLWFNEYVSPGGIPMPVAIIGRITPSGSSPSSRSLQAMTQAI